MSDALTVVEVEAQHLELLPRRTVLGVLSILGLGGGDGMGGDGGSNAAHNVKGDVFQHADGGQAKGGDGALKGLLGNLVK